MEEYLHITVGAKAGTAMHGNPAAQQFGMGGGGILHEKRDMDRMTGIV